jgi:hypothetical protein
MKYFILLVVLFLIAGCKKNENPVNSGEQVEVGAITEISGTISSWNPNSTYNIIKLYAAEGTAKIISSSVINPNGSFLISLANFTMPTLEPISSEGFPSGFSVSNPNAKVSHTCFVGVFQTQGSTTPSYDVSFRNDTYEYIYIYCNSDLTIKGDVTLSGVRYNFDFVLKPGWNKICSTIGGTGNETYREMTNKIISNGTWH